MNTKCLIFNSKGQFWNWTTRKFQEEPLNVVGSFMEFKMAKKSDSSADLVEFDEPDWNIVVEKCKIGEPFAIIEKGE